MLGARTLSGILELACMTSPEVAAATKGVRAALQPIGATEQHGPNLATGTDFAVADKIARRVAKRLGPKTLLLPPLPFGLSHHHAGFPGTITLSPGTVIDLCLDVARSIHRHGIGALIFVNGHNGNTAVLNVAATRIRYEVGLTAAVAFYFAQASDRIRAHGKTERFGHACEVETSVLLHLEPELVRTDSLEPGKMRETSLQHAFNNDPFALQVPIPFDRQTENGVFGDARLADEKTGRDIVETAVERTVAFINSLGDAELTPQPPLHPSPGDSTP